MSNPEGDSVQFSVEDSNPQEMTTLPENIQATGPDQNDVARRARKWQLILYIINFFTALAGIILMGVAGYAKNSPQSIALPAFALNIIIAFGLIILLISLIGCYGAFRAPDQIANKRVNWVLWVYFTIIFLCVILQLVAGGILLTQLQVLDDAASSTVMQGTNVFEQQLREVIKESYTTWVQIQETYNCCGYNCSIPKNVDCPPGSGKPCCPDDEVTWSPCLSEKINETDPFNTKFTRNTCRAELLAYAKSHASTVGGLAIFFGVVEIFAVAASFALQCCVRVDYELEK